MTNSNFLKKLLATASVVAVSASAGNAFATARVTIGNAQLNGAGLEQKLVPPGPAANEAVAATSTITFRGAHTYTDGAGGAVNLAGLKVDGNFVATIDSTAAGNNYTLGSVTRTGSIGVVNINLDNARELTLTGTGTTAKGYIANLDTTGAPGNQADWAFAAADNDYTGLGQITFNNNNDKLIINSGAQLNKAVRANANGNGIIEANGSNVIFGGGITNGVGLLDIKDGKAATLGAASSVNVVKIGNESSLLVANNTNVTSNNIKGSVADKGTLKFEGISTVNATKIGDGAKLNTVELAGAGIVNFAKTTDFTATKTTLTHADAVLKFSKGATVETEIGTATDGKGKVIVSEDIAFKGNIGENGKSLAEVNFGANKTLTFEKDDTKLYAGDVTTSAGNTGKLDIKSANFEIHSNVGAEGKVLNAVQIYSNAAANAATTVKLMDGKSIHATSVDLSKAANNNILELHEGSSITGNVIASNANSGILSIKGDAKIDGTIGAVGNEIDQIKFAAVKTLEVTKNAFKTNTGINFAEDGVLKLTQDANVTFDKVTTTKVVAGGTGSILINGAASGRMIDIQAQVGDTAVKNNSLKLLQARGGADIKLSNGNISIEKIDIETQDSSLILNNAGSFLIGNFSHTDGKGTLKLDNNATLKTGTNLSSGATNTLKTVNLGANKTLTLEDGIDIYTTNDINGGIRSNALGDGILTTEGNSTIGAVVGAGNAIGSINVNGNNKTANFLNNVNLSKNGNGTGILTIDNGATAVLGGGFVGEEITGKAGGQGTVKFNNSVALENATKVTAQIGANQLDTVEIGGADITFANAQFETQNLKFSNNGNTTATFSGFAAGNELQNTTITTTSTTRQHNIVLTKGQDQAFNQNVGTDQNRFGNFVLTGDDTIDANGVFYAGVVNSKNQEGTVNINNNGNVALNLGAEGSELKAVNINGNATLHENVWSKDIIVAAGATATVRNSVMGSGALTLNNNSVANFTGDTANLNILVVAGGAGQGTLTFSNAASINANIGAVAKRLNNVDFVGKNTSDIVDVNANIFANNINVGAQTIRANQNIELNGATSFNNGSHIDLGTNKITLKNGNSRIVGASGVNVTLDANKVTGSIIVDATGGATNLDTTNATGVTINVNDSFAMLPVADETYTLISAANGGTITPIAANIATVNSSGNNFVNWSLNGNNLVRKNVAANVLTNTLGTGDKELLQDALQFVNANNKGKAAEYASELSRMDSNRLKESIERSSEQNSVHAVEIASSLLESTNAAINNRMGAFSNHPQPGVQIASQGVSGISAGEGDHTMYGAWVSPFYNQTTQKARGSRAGFKSSTYGATLGFDTQANADLTVGVAGTYAKSDVKHKNFKSGDKTKGDTFAFSIYGIQQLTNNWFLQGHAAYATTKMKNSEKRIAATTSETARSEFDVTSYNAELLAGFNYNMGEAIITPLVGASYTRINNSGYTETGTTNQNLTVSSKATNKFDAVAGLRGQMTTEMNGINITPEIHGFVRHDLVGKDSRTTAKLSGMVNSLTPKSAKAIKTTFNVGLGVNAVSGMYEYGAGYDLFAANKTIGHQGTLKVRVNF